MDFPFWPDDDRAGRLRFPRMVWVGTAVVLILVIYFAYPVLRDRFHDWFTDSTHDANGVTYYDGTIPDPVAFDVDGVRIGDSLEKAKSHFEFLPGQESKSTGLLGHRIVEFGDGDAKAKITFDFYFKDSKVIAFGLTFPFTCFDALVESYNKKLGAILYKRRFERGTVKFRDGVDGPNEIVSWRTTDGDFNLQQFNRDATHGWGEIGYSQWKLAEMDEDSKEHERQQRRIQSQIDGKL
jgi:hypothetical protein